MRRQLYDCFTAMNLTLFPGKTTATSAGAEKRAKESIGVHY